MADRFQIKRSSDPFWPGELLTLRDRESRSWARLVPGLGASLVGFGMELDDRRIETFLQPTDETPSDTPGHYGAPVLFPFPNRLRGGQAELEGQTIQIARRPGEAHAIHGLVRERGWTVEQVATSADGALARCAISSDPALLRQFPFPFRLSLSFRLSGATLRVEIEVRNPGRLPLPFGFGWHPYFRLPLGPGGDRRREIVQIPAGRLWELDPEQLPTGRILPAPPERTFLQPAPLGDVALDHAYTDVTRAADGSSACHLLDPTTGAQLRITAGPSFREWIAFAPTIRPTIAFEPYTCPADAFNLSARGINAGVIVVPPGESWRDWIELRLRLG